MDIDPEIGLARAAARGALDRIEREQIEFFQRTRAVYLALAEQKPNVLIIDASQSLEQVQNQISDKLTNWLATNT